MTQKSAKMTGAFAKFLISKFCQEKKIYIVSLFYYEMKNKFPSGISFAAVR